MQISIVRTGTSHYDGTVESPVDVVALDYDWWFRLAEADGLLDEGEEPCEMGTDGFLYYVRLRDALKRSMPIWVESQGHRTPLEAMRDAESKVRGGIRWAT